MNKKKKVGVLTFHDYDNYGAILQSYALQKKLEELNVKAELIDYRCDYIHKVFGLSSLKKRGLFTYIYTVIGHICYLPRRRKCNQFRKKLHYSPRVRQDDKKRISQRYDVFIAGSDQIWDYRLTDFDKTYFFDFVESGRLCSYAASIGENLPPQEYQEEYAKLLSRFDRILVREEYGADIVEGLTGARPDISCDPTLLFTREQWEELAKDPKTKEPYILVYQLGINREIVDFTKKLAEQTGLKVKYVPFPLVGLLKCQCNIAVGPQEWIGLFKNAEYVISDSFHGIVFALLFNRKFFTLVHGHHMNKRVEQLLKKVNLTEQIIENMENDLQEGFDREIDFTYANEVIRKMREESFALLKELVE